MIKFLLSGAFLVIILIFGYVDFIAREKIKRRRLLKKINEIADPQHNSDGKEAQTKLTGLAMSDEAIVSPFSGRECIYYEVKLWATKRYIGTETREFILSDAVCSNFRLVLPYSSYEVPGNQDIEFLPSDDTIVESGKISHPSGTLKKFLKKHGLSLQEDYYFVESVIEPGEEITVIGSVQKKKGKLTIKSYDDHLILSNTPEASGYSSGLLA